jgi:signal transduction histidine kinase
VKDKTPRRSAARETTEADRLELLSQTVRALLISEDPLKLLDEIYPRLAKRLGLDACFHYRFVEAENRLRLTWHRGVPPDKAAAIEWLEVGDAVCGRVAQHRKGHRVDDVQADDEPATKLLRELGVTAYMSEPLISGGRLIGTLAFGTRRRKAFADEDAALLRGVAELLAVAIDRWQARQELEQRVVERTERLRSLAAEVTGAEHAERRRLARVLHDHLQQLLVASKFSATLLAREAEADKRAEQGKRLMELIDGAISESRSLSVELAPPVLYQSGLAAALAWLADQMRHKHGMDVEVSADQADEPAGEAMRALLFQGARELLLNVAKHAGVNQAKVQLDSQSGVTRLSVEDDGRGMPEETTGGQGLAHLRRRLDLLGGKLVLAAPEARPGEKARRPASSGRRPRGLRVELHAPRQARRPGAP